MNHRKRLLITCILLTMVLIACQAFSQTAAKKPAPKQAPAATQPSDQELNIRAYIELLRSDVRSEATAIIQEMMQLSESEGDKFWPIYREYELELSKQGDKKVALIKEYSENYQSMTDEVANKLVWGTFELEQSRLELKKKYYERIKAALSAKTAARFLQVNNQILMLIDLQIASSLPVVQ